MERGVHHDQVEFRFRVSVQPAPPVVEMYLYLRMSDAGARVRIGERDRAVSGIDLYDIDALDLVVGRQHRSPRASGHAELEYSLRIGMQAGDQIGPADIVRVVDRINVERSIEGASAIDDLHD